MLMPILCFYSLVGIESALLRKEKNKIVCTTCINLVFFFHVWGQWSSARKSSVLWPFQNAGLFLLSKATSSSVPPKRTVPGEGCPFLPSAGYLLKPFCAVSSDAWTYVFYTFCTHTNLVVSVINLWKLRVQIFTLSQDFLP